MDCHIVIEKLLLCLMVTIGESKIQVKNILPCKYKEKLCDIFAESEEILLAGYLRREKIDKNLYPAILQYYQNKNWQTTELTPECQDEL